MKIGRSTRCRPYPSGQRLNGSSVVDFAEDPENGDIWAAQHAMVEWSQDLSGQWNRVFLGGGVARFDLSESAWWAWGKRKGALLRAHSDGSTDGEMSSVFADRVNGKAWAGSWASDARFHWIDGFGVHAALNSCPPRRLPGYELGAC